MTTSSQNKQYHHGTGRRKTAIAQVRITPGVGAVVINSKPIEEALPLQASRHAVLEPFRVTNTQEKFNAVAKVVGGGVAAQAGAVRHGLARALVAADESLKPVLRKAGLMTRDSRIKERKKYGLKRARKAPQYTKR